MNILKVITGVSKLTGSRISTTLNKEALEQVLKQKGVAAKFTEVFRTLKEPYVDVAMKASKNGYTIGAFRLRDGKEVIASGAASVTNLGTPNSVVKMRLNYGENGNAVRAHAFMDNSKKYKLADADIELSRKKGVITFKEQIGKAAGGGLRIDEKAVAQFSDRLTGTTFGTEGYQFIKDSVNKFGADGQKLYKKLLAGQDISKEYKKMQDYGMKFAGLIEKRS